jgi:hypothetical protein
MLEQENAELRWQTHCLENMLGDQDQHLQVMSSQLQLQLQGRRKVWLGGTFPDISEAGHGHAEPSGWVYGSELRAQNPTH